MVPLKLVLSDSSGEFVVRGNTGVVSISRVTRGGGVVSWVSSRGSGWGDWGGGDSGGGDGDDDGGGGGGDGDGGGGGGDGDEKS